MDHIATRRRYQHFGVLFCLFFLLSACGQLSGNGSPSTSVLTKRTATIPTATLEQAQSCPPQASARAAIIPTLPSNTSNYSTLVYVSQQGDSSTLLRYNVSTGLRQTLLQTLAGESIQRANVSPDGQWIVLQALLQDRIAIQLIRLDGQKLQTLYCATPQDSIDDALLSPDQHTLVFNQENQDELSTLYLLDMATGKLRTELSPLSANYPGGIAQGQAQTALLSERVPFTVHDKTNDKLTMQPFNPLAGRHYLIYVPMKWVNNSSLYLYGTVHASGAPLRQLAFLRDTSKDVTQQGSNLQLIATAGQDSTCQDLDVTPTSGQLVCSGYTFTRLFPLPNTITMWPITGGLHHTVYSGLQTERIIARAISNSTLIFLFTRANGLPTLWKINTDGSGPTQLMAAQTTGVDLEFASSSYLPWSIAARNGKYYALTMYTLTSNVTSLIVGDLNSGQPKTIASSVSPLLLAGWA